MYSEGWLQIKRRGRIRVDGRLTEEEVAWELIVDQLEKRQIEG